MMEFAGIHACKKSFKPTGGDACDPMSGAPIPHQGFSYKIPEGARFVRILTFFRQFAMVFPDAVLRKTDSKDVCFIS